MLSQRAVIPARRCARAAMQGIVAAIRPLSPPQPTQPQQPQQQRQYAMSSPTVRRLARRSKKDRLLFEQSDVPPLELWQQFSNANGLGGLSPEKCRRVVKDYCSVATDLTSSWKQTLETEHDIDLYSLHWAALPMAIRGQKTLGAAIGAHMLQTASTLGYAPSTLTGVSLVVRSGRDVLSKPLARAFLARFEPLLRQGNDPDAFTLKGLLVLLETRSGTSALPYFDKAIQAAKSLPPTAADGQNPVRDGSTPAARQPRWSFEASCHHHRGLILRQMRQTQKAVDAFRIAALELGHVESCVELIKLLPRDAPERETCLYAAAQAGIWGACDLLAHHLADKAADPAVAQGERVLAAELAREWARVNPDEAKQKETLERVAELTEVVAAR